MNECGAETSVVDWVIEHPQALALLEELGVDYSCGGKSLEFACRERGLDVQAVLSRLRRSVEIGERSADEGVTTRSKTTSQYSGNANPHYS